MPAVPAPFDRPTPDPVVAPAAAKLPDGGGDRGPAQPVEADLPPRLTRDYPDGCPLQVVPHWRLLPNRGADVLHQFLDQSRVLSGDWCCLKPVGTVRLRHTWPLGIRGEVEDEIESVLMPCSSSKAPSAPWAATKSPSPARYPATLPCSTSGRDAPRGRCAGTSPSGRR